MQKFDVLVAGGGLVGAAFACALGATRLTNHLRVGIIEPGKWKTELKENDSGSLLRVSALSPSTKNFLEVIGAWEDVSSPYYKMQVWDAQPYSSTGSVTFSSTNSQPIGYMMQNDVILNLLRQKIDQLQNLSVIASSVSGINYSDTNHQEVNNILSKDSIPSPPVIVTTSSGETIETKLLVVADGPNSHIRNLLNITTSGWKYDQKGIVQTFSFSLAPEARGALFQRFLPTGPLAILPLQNDLCSIVWSCPTQYADRLLKLSDEEFIKKINLSLRGKLLAENHNSVANFIFSNCNEILSKVLPGEAPKDIPLILESKSKRAAFPFQSMSATTYVKPRVALIGDCAHVVHPLAGQGLNLGISDAATLSSAIVHSVRSGTDFSSNFVLQRWESERITHNRTTQFTVDTIKALFESTSLPLIYLRHFGFNLTNNLDFAKDLFAKHAQTNNVDLSLLGSNLDELSVHKL